MGSKIGKALAAISAALVAVSGIADQLAGFLSTQAQNFFSVPEGASFLVLLPVILAGLIGGVNLVVSLIPKQPE